MDMPAFGEIKYERPSVEVFRECVMRVRLRIMAARTAEVVEAAFMEFQKEYSHFETAMTMCMIRHSMNVKDDFYLGEVEFFEEASPVVSELATSVYKALANTQLEAECKEKFGEMIFRKAHNRIDVVSKEIVPLLSKEAALQNEYDRLLAEAVVPCRGKEYNLSTVTPLLESRDRDARKDAAIAVADFYADHSEQLDRIFDELISLRTEMAKTLGYENFVELGYKRMERYDFSPEMAEEFRNLVLAYIVPITKEIRRLQMERLDCGELKFYDLRTLFASGNPYPVIEEEAFSGAVAEMFREIFEKEPSFYDVLESHGFTDLEPRFNKSTGGFCTTLLDYGIPFVFLNANRLAEDVTTLIHECGHAYAAIRSAECSPFFECLAPTLETCEIHSTAMEYLSYPYMEKFFGDGAEAYRELHMTQSLLFLPYGCMVDEFQHIVYTKPDLRPQERHQVWKTLEEKYQPYLDYDDISFYEKGGAWQMKGHIFTDPFYYIDYCLAQVAALDLWDISTSHYRKALLRYDQLCMEGGTAAFMELLDKSRLSSPFSEATMKRVAYKACSFLAL